METKHQPKTEKPSPENIWKTLVFPELFGEVFSGNYVCNSKLTLNHFDVYPFFKKKGKSNKLEAKLNTPNFISFSFSFSILLL